MKLNITTKRRLKHGEAEAAEKKKEKERIEAQWEKEKKLDETRTSYFETSTEKNLFDVSSKFACF